MGTTSVGEINGGRTFTVDCANGGLPDSVFLYEVGGAELCLEFDRHEFINALKLRFNLYEAFDLTLERLLAETVTAA